MLDKVSALDRYRMTILQREWDVKSFSKDKEYYQSQWREIFGSETSHVDVRRLGEELRPILKGLGGSRTNKNLAGAGTAFESVVSWYLNLLFWGTPIIVGRRHSSLPQVFNDISTITIDGKKSNSETDLIAFSVPDSQMIDWNYGKAALNDHLKRSIKKVDLTIIQTKTNWADNAQVPMLWNMIYNVKDFRIPNIHIGHDGFSPLSLRELRYAFITIPSQTTLNSFKASSINVKRVKTLSGGNYWCCPEKDDVALALHQFPARNFSSQIAETKDGNLWGHVQRNIDEVPYLLDSFL